MELRTEAQRAIDAFMANGDLGALLRWVNANRKAVYAGRDSEAQALVDKARATIDAVLKGSLTPENARQHLRNLLQPPRDMDGPGGPSRRFS